MKQTALLLFFLVACGSDTQAYNAQNTSLFEYTVKLPDNTYLLGVLSDGRITAQQVAHRALQLAKTRCKGRFTVLFTERRNEHTIQSFQQFNTYDFPDKKSYLTLDKPSIEIQFVCL